MADTFSFDARSTATDHDGRAAEILAVTKQLLKAIASGDWRTYERLCAADITCFEPEARGHLVGGHDFHRFYFETGGAAGAHNVTLVEPRVRMLGPDAAVIAYVRLVQALDASNNPVVRASEETRIWQKSDGAWKHVHFHRSPAP